MATTQQPYIDLATLKAQLRLADGSQDDYLTNLIPMVQGFIDNYTHRTFGWGDDGDIDTIDYSNTDNIGVLTAVLDVDDPTQLIVSTMGPVPWVAGQNVSLFVMPTLAWNGVWEVTDVNNPAEIVVDISNSKGTLSLSDQAAIANNIGSSAQGYIGNYVQNYSYRSQEQYDGLVGKTIYLRNSDIRSVDTLYIGLRNIAQPVLLDHTQYVWRDDGRIILGGAYFNSYDSSIYQEANDNSFYGTVAAGYQTITVSYWHGYIGVPTEIALAALDICSGMYTLRSSLGIRMEDVGDYRIQYEQSFRQALKAQPDSLNTLNRYRRLHI